MVEWRLEVHRGESSDFGVGLARPRRTPVWSGGRQGEVVPSRVLELAVDWGDTVCVSLSAIEWDVVCARASRWAWPWTADIVV